MPRPRRCRSSHVSAAAVVLSCRAADRDDSSCSLSLVETAVNVD